MSHCKLWSFFILFLFNLSVKAQESKHFSVNDGTYISVSLINVKDTNYIRIRFLNDSTFAFTLAESPLNDRDMGTFLKYNYSIFSGIGRRILLKGKKSWVGIIDEDMNGLITRAEKKYYSTDNILTLQQALDSIPPSYYLYNQYVLIHFLFVNMNEIALNIIKKPAGRFKVSNAYRKVDSQQLSFRIEGDYNYNPYSHQFNKCPIKIIAKGTSLHLLPISDSVSNIKNGFLKTGTKFLLPNIPLAYTKYVFVLALDKNGVVGKYGWVPRDYIKN